MEVASIDVRMGEEAKTWIHSRVENVSQKRGQGKEVGYLVKVLDMGYIVLKDSVKKTVILTMAHS